MGAKRLYLIDRPIHRAGTNGRVVGSTRCTIHTSGTLPPVLVTDKPNRSVHIRSQVLRATSIAITDTKLHRSEV
jgi:hypothetical protein